MSIAARLLVLVNRPRFCMNAIFLSGVLLGLGACGGSSGSPEVVARPTDIDTSYATQGQAVFPLGAKVGGVGPSVMQTDGKLVIAGWRQTAPLPDGAKGGYPPQEVYVLRLNGDGSRDASFGSGGEVRFNVKGSDAPVTVRMQPDGKILLEVRAVEPCVGVFIAQCMSVYGTGAVNTAGVIALVRLTTAGLLDVSFGGTGIVLGVGDAVIPQADGKVLLLNLNYIYGEPSYPSYPVYPVYPLLQISGWFMERYTDKGTLDTSFNNGNPVSSTCKTENATIVIQTDEKIVVGGSRYNDSDPTLGHGFCLERINADGSHDLNYRKDGLWTTFDSHVELTRLWLLPGDEVLAVGKSCDLTTCSLIAARFDNSGQLDSSFGVDGVAKVAIDNNYYLTSSFLVTQTGGLVMRGLHALAATAGEPQAYQPFLIEFDAIGQASIAYGENGILPGGADAKELGGFMRDNMGRWLLVNSRTLPDGNLEIVVNRLIGESLGSI